MYIDKLKLHHEIVALAAGLALAGFMFLLAVYGARWCLYAVTCQCCCSGVARKEAELSRRSKLLGKLILHDNLAAAQANRLLGARAGQPQRAADMLQNSQALTTALADSTSMAEVRQAVVGTRSTSWCVDDAVGCVAACASCGGSCVECCASYALPVGGHGQQDGLDFYHWHDGGPLVPPELVVDERSVPRSGRSARKRSSGYPAFRAAKSAARLPQTGSLRSWPVLCAALTLLSVAFAVLYIVKRIEDVENAAILLEDGATSQLELGKSILKSWPDGIVGVVSHNGAVAITTTKDLDLDGFMSRRDVQSSSETGRDLKKAIRRAKAGVSLPKGIIQGFKSSRWHKDGEGRFRVPLELPASALLGVSPACQYAEDVSMDGRLQACRTLNAVSRLLSEVPWAGINDKRQAVARLVASNGNACNLEDKTSSRFSRHRRRGTRAPPKGQSNKALKIACSYLGSQQTRMAAVSAAVDQRLLSPLAMQVLQDHWRGSSHALQLIESGTAETPALVFGLSNATATSKSQLDRITGPGADLPPSGTTTAATEILLQSPASIRLRLIRRMSELFDNFALLQAQPAVCQGNPQAGPFSWEFEHVEVDEAFQRLGTMHPSQVARGSERPSHFPPSDHGAKASFKDPAINESSVLDVLMREPLALIDELQQAVRKRSDAKQLPQQEDPIWSKIGEHLDGYSQLFSQALHGRDGFIAMEAARRRRKRDAPLVEANLQAIQAAQRQASDDRAQMEETMANGGIWRAIGGLPRGPGATHDLLQSMCTDLGGLSASSDDKTRSTGGFARLHREFFLLAGLEVPDPLPQVGLPRLLCTKPKLEQSIEQLEKTLAIGRSRDGSEVRSSLVSIVALAVTLLTTSSVVGEVWLQAAYVMFWSACCHLSLFPWTYFTDGPSCCETLQGSMIELRRQGRTSWLATAARVAQLGVDSSSVVAQEASSAGVAQGLNESIRKAAESLDTTKPTPQQLAASATKAMQAIRLAGLPLPDTLVAPLPDQSMRGSNNHTPAGSTVRDSDVDDDLDEPDTYDGHGASMVSAITPLGPRLEGNQRVSLSLSTLQGVWLDPSEASAYGVFAGRVPHRVLKPAVMMPLFSASMFLYGLVVLLSACGDLAWVVTVRSAHDQLRSQHVDLIARMEQAELQDIATSSGLRDPLDAISPAVASRVLWSLPASQTEYSIAAGPAGTRSYAQEAIRYGLFDRRGRHISAAGTALANPLQATQFAAIKLMTSLGSLLGLQGELVLSGSSHFRLGHRKHASHSYGYSSESDALVEQQVQAIQEADLTTGIDAGTGLDRTAGALVPALEWQYRAALQSNEHDALKYSGVLHLRALQLQTIILRKSIERLQEELQGTADLWWESGRLQHLANSAAAQAQANGLVEVNLEVAIADAARRSGVPDAVQFTKIATSAGSRWRAAAEQCFAAGELTSYSGSEKYGSAPPIIVEPQRDPKQQSIWINSALRSAVSFGAGTVLANTRVMGVVVPIIVSQVAILFLWRGQRLEWAAWQLRLLRWYALAVQRGVQVAQAEHELGESSTVKASTTPNGTQDGIVDNVN